MQGWGGGGFIQPRCVSSVEGARVSGPGCLLNEGLGSLGSAGSMLQKQPVVQRPIRPLRFSCLAQNAVEVWRGRPCNNDNHHANMNPIRPLRFCCLGQNGISGIGHILWLKRRPKAIGHRPSHHQSGIVWAQTWCVLHEREILLHRQSLGRTFLSQVKQTTSTGSAVLGTIWVYPKSRSGLIRGTRRTTCLDLLQSVH